MLKRIIFWLAPLIGVTSLGQQILEGAGYLLVILPNGLTTIEMSFWLGVGFIVASWLVVLIFSQFLLWIGQPFASFKRERAHKKLLKSSNQTLVGLNLLATGQWGTAKRRLTQASKNHHSLVNLLAAAQAAYYEGNLEESTSLLKDAEAQQKTSPIGVELTQARMLLEQNQQEQALASLMRLYQVQRNNPIVLRLLAKLRLDLSDYEPLIDLLPELKRHKVFTNDELDTLQLAAYQGFFASSNLVDNAEKLAKAKRLWPSLPLDIQQNEALIANWVDSLLKAEEVEAAENLLINSLKNNWSSALMNQLSQLSVNNDSKGQLALAQNWLKKRPNDAELLHSLGRISQKLEMWDNALEHYLASHKLAVTAPLCLEIAQLYTALGNLEAAATFNAQAVEAMQKQLVSLPLPAVSQ